MYHTHKALLSKSVFCEVGAAAGKVFGVVTILFEPSTAHAPGTPFQPPPLDSPVAYFGGWDPYAPDYLGKLPLNESFPFPSPDDKQTLMSM